VSEVQRGPWADDPIREEGWTRVGTMNRRGYWEGAPQWPTLPPPGTIRWR
jgi:hypothetical protein